MRVLVTPEFMTKPPMRGWRGDGSPMALEQVISDELWDQLFVWDDLFQDRFLDDPAWKQSVPGRLYAEMAPRLIRRVAFELGEDCRVTVDLWPLFGHRARRELIPGEVALVSEPMAKVPVVGIPPGVLSQELRDDLCVWGDLFQDRFLSDPQWAESFEGRLYVRMAPRLASRVCEESGRHVSMDLWPRCVAKGDDCD